MIVDMDIYCGVCYKVVSAPERPQVSQYHWNKPKIYDDILQWFNFHSFTQTPIGMIKNKNYYWL